MLRVASLSLFLLLGCWTASARAADEQPNPPIEAHGVTLTWRSLNMSYNVDLRSGASQRQVSLQGQLQFPPDRRYAAFIVEPTEVIDTKGRHLMQQRNNRWSGHTRNWPVHRIRHHGDQSVTQGLSLSLSDLMHPQATIDTVRGKVYLLEVTEEKPVDIPLSDGAAWTDIRDGLKVRFAQREKQSSYHNIHIEYTGNQSDALTTLGQTPFVFTARAVDAAGDLIPLRSPAYMYNSGGHRGAVRLYPKDKDATIDRLRLILATTTIERQIDFELTDLAARTGE